MKQEKNVIQIQTADNVAVVIEAVEAGQSLEAGPVRVVCQEPIGSGHKAALAPIMGGEPVIKYGAPIGRATRDIEPGAWVHSHNLVTNLAGVDEYTYTPAGQPLPPIADERTFQGFVRDNGEVGVRNEIWVIPTVSCINNVAMTLARRMNAVCPHGSVSGVYAFPHPYGCSQLGGDHVRTQTILADFVKHPNAGGVLVIGLGCEENTMEDFQRVLGPVNPQRVRFVVAQECEDELEAGMRELHALADYAGQFQREPVSVARLRVGFKCGASDGFSGITANPLVGAFSDLLVARGGTTVLTEVPEMFGAEGPLLNRCVTREIFAQGVQMINDFKEYYLQHGLPVYENPSPGNKASGITTLEEKSLGCVQKGGTSPVVDVLDYGERLQHPGLTLLAAPGNDFVSLTALAAAGAQLVLFTTGRGNPLGSPVPTVKIATNSRLAQRKPHWIDVDAGVLLRGTPMETLAEQLFQTVLRVASGTLRVRNEHNDDRQIGIWKDGVTV